MSELKDIVPPLELCKRIPAGAFEDSALVWECYERFFRGIDIIGQSDRVTFRNDDQNNTVSRCSSTKYYPAPTLAEILAKLPFTDGSNRTPICCGRWVDDLSIWVVGYRNIDELRKTDKNNPAAAALRLWLKVKGDDDVR